MNSKGVLFTILALIFVLSIIGLNESIKEARQGNLESRITVNAINTAGNKYNTLLRDLVNLDKNGKSKQVQERFLPFNYEIQNSRITIMQELPLSGIAWKNYFDILNALRVFSEDFNYSNVFDSLKTEFETIKNPEWNGSSEEITHLITPQCLGFSVMNDYDKNDYKKAVLKPEETQECSFSESEIAKIDLNIVINESAEDFNAAESKLASFGSIPLEIRINNTACLPNCQIADENKTINAFLSVQDKNLTIQGVNSKTITIRTVNNSIEVEHEGPSKINANFGIIFQNDFQEFKLKDFNVTVRNEDFNISKTNKT